MEKGGGCWGSSKATLGENNIRGKTGQKGSMTKIFVEEEAIVWPHQQSNPPRWHQFMVESCGKVCPDKMLNGEKRWVKKSEDPLARRRRIGKSVRSRLVETHRLR